MTEEEARALAATIAGSAMPLVERFAGLLLAENERQNLIARATEATVWSRHLLDSLQLARFARAEDRTWVDVGSGPGLPGLLLATLGRWTMTLVEPRRRRADFLRDALEHLSLKNVVVLQGDIRDVVSRFDLVTARAVAPLDQLFDLTRGCVDARTRYVLPKGRTARADVDLAIQEWQGSFHVEQSLTNPDAGIVIAEGVRRR